MGRFGAQVHGQGRVGGGPSGCVRGWDLCGGACVRAWVREGARAGACLHVCGRWRRGCLRTRASEGACVGVCLGGGGWCHVCELCTMEDKSD